MRQDQMSEQGGVTVRHWGLFLTLSLFHHTLTSTHIHTHALFSHCWWISKTFQQVPEQTSGAPRALWYARIQPTYPSVRVHTHTHARAVVNNDDFFFISRLGHLKLSKYYSKRSSSTIKCHMISAASWDEIMTKLRSNRRSFWLITDISTSRQKHINEETETSPLRGPVITLWRHQMWN